jgi:hypothetical protein
MAGWEGPRNCRKAKHFSHHQQHHQAAVSIHGNIALLLVHTCDSLAHAIASRRF